MKFNLLLSQDGFKKLHVTFIKVREQKKLLVDIIQQYGCLLVVGVKLKVVLYIFFKKNNNNF